MAGELFNLRARRALSRWLDLGGGGCRQQGQRQLLGRPRVQEGVRRHRTGFLGRRVQNQGEVHTASSS